MTHTSDTRFTDAKSEEYQLIRQVMPHFDAMQQWVGRLCAEYCIKHSSAATVLDIGCGDGLTSEGILRAAPPLKVVAIDPEPKMITQASENLRDFIQVARCQVIQDDALGYLQQSEDCSFDIVASALTLHNLQKEYRFEVHRHIFRVLKPGGLFVNADKYAPQNDKDRFDALGVALKRFFDTFLPAAKYDLLQDWVLHNVADQSPDRCMKADDAVGELSNIGFTDIIFHERSNMEAVLSARKTI